MMWTSAVSLVSELVYICWGRHSSISYIRNTARCPELDVRLPEAFLPMYFFW